MRIYNNENVKIKFPISITKEECRYLSELNAKRLCLKVLRDEISRTHYNSLRGRKYASLRDMDTDVAFENEIPTKNINSLIEKGYLFVIHIHRYYFYVVPNPNIVGYLNYRTASMIKEYFPVENTEIKIKPVMLTSQLVKKDYSENTMQNNKSIGYFVLKAGLPRGLDHTYVFHIEGTDNQYLVVSPTGDKTTILQKKEGVTVQKVPLEVTLSSNLIKITSTKYATSYINCTKSTPINLQEIEKDLKKSYKLLSQYKIRTKEKSKNLALVKDPEYIEAVNNFNRLSEQYWKELTEKSKQLVEEGIVFGGLDKNPLYKEAWEIQNKLNDLRLDSKIRKLSSIKRSISDLDYHSEENLEDCSLYVIR